MPTIVSLEARDLVRAFPKSLLPKINLQSLAAEVKTVLTTSPFDMGVTGVKASLAAGDKVVQFTIEPAGLDPKKVKEALL